MVYNNNMRARQRRHAKITAPKLYGLSQRSLWTTTTDMRRLQQRIDWISATARRMILWISMDFYGFFHGFHGFSMDFY